MKLAILALEGCMHSAIAGVADILSLANHVTQQSGAKTRFAWEVLSLDGKPVRAGGGQMVAVDGAVGKRGRFDAILVPATSSIMSPRNACNRNMPAPARGFGSGVRAAG
ncbi:hypothetical protein ACQ5SK_46070 [Bradyrhizobium japonicum]